jgi:hypothetical protein
MRVTPTAFLGSWGQKLIKYMTSLGTDFETHAYWQRYTEEPTAKDFVARKARTIASSKGQGTPWDRIKCKERLGNCPEAVIRQATINLYSRVWKSLEDSFPELFCVDLAEAYVTQERMSLRIFVRKKGMICNIPNRHLHQKPLAKCRNGKENRYCVYYQVPASILL